MNSFKMASMRAKPFYAAKPLSRRLVTQTASSKGSQKGTGWSDIIPFAIGLPAGWYLYYYVHLVTTAKVAPTHDVYEGSLEWKGKAVKPFTIADADDWLRKEQSTHDGPPGSGVKSWSISRRPSNSVCEDDLVTAHAQVSPGSPWLFWGVFDGHAGWATSATLRESLVPYVVRGLSKLSESFWRSDDSFSQSVEATIKSTFQELDDEILGDGIEALKSGKSKTEILSRLAPGYAGSCALLSMYDPNTKILRVACTGDSRAVLGRRNPKTGEYAAEALSVDQTGFEKSELARVQNAHPGELEVINTKTGRTLGIAVIRAFGDGLWKWPIDVVKECHEKFFYRAPRPGYKTPPYLIVEPVVTTTRIRDEGEFMIMASDGLWEQMSSEQAVKLVSMWLTAHQDGTIGTTAVKSKSWRPTSMKGIQDEQTKDEKNFVVEDENVATHLIRNAFGGCDYEILLGVVGTPAPLSRELRDDITFQVVFFGERQTKRLERGQEDKSTLREPCMQSNIPKS